MEKTFLLFNQELTIDETLLLAIYLRHKVMIAAKNAQKTFEEYYPKFNSIEGLLKKGEDIAGEILAASAQSCVDALVGININFISANAILSNMRGSYFVEGLNELEKWYLSVLQSEADKDAYRTARRKNRSKWVGFGFGIQGALTGAAKAGALNMLSGAAHGTANMIGKSFSMLGTSMNKSQVFNSKDTCNKLAMALYMDIFDWIYFLQATVEREGFDIKKITQVDEEQAENYFQNLKRTSLSQSQAYNVAFQMFKTNPAKWEYYKYCIMSFPEQQKNLLELAEYCAFDTQPLKERILKKIVDSMPHRSEEDTLKLYQTLKEKQAELAISSSEIIDNTERKLEKFDVDARTYRKMIFATREMRVEAERNYEKLSEISKKFDRKSKDECLQAIEAIKAESNIPVVEEYFLSDFKKQIKKIEKESEKAAYDTLLASYSERNPELAKFRVKTKVLGLFWKLCLLVCVLSLILAFLALLDGEILIALLMLGPVVLFAVLGVWIETKTEKIKAVAKELMPPELADALEKLEKASKEYENSERENNIASGRFWGSEDSLTEIDMSGRATSIIRKK